jgi:hypothetical protein
MIDSLAHELRLRAENFEDIQRARIRLQNRERAYAGTPEDDDEAHWKDLIDAIDREVGGTHSAALRALMEAEKVAQEELVSLYREIVTPAIKAWQKRTKGIGEHMLARLLGTIGDPYVAIPLDFERNPTGPSYYRNVSTLWAYCGHGAATKRRKGMDKDDAKALGNDRAKMLTHLMAESVIKARNDDYREVYDWEKARFMAVTDMTKGHAHAHALRVVGKHILRDLWVAARQDREVASFNPPAKTHTSGDEAASRTTKRKVKKAS